MPAVHEFKYNRKVLQFTDTDILNAVDNKSNIDHAAFMAACRRVVTSKPGEQLFDDSEWEDIMAALPGELDKNFQFAMTSLVREVYTI